jgi:hypothetical protein
MKDLAFYLNRMNMLLDELIGIAGTLRDLSMQVVSEEELNALQIKQKEFLSELESVDQIIEEKFWNEIEDKDHHMLHTKIHTFKSLNQEFIQNLKESHGLIQFELAHLQGQEEDNEQYSKTLNKVTPSPSPSKTVKPKKTKKT